MNFAVLLVNLCCLLVSFAVLLVNLCCLLVSSYFPRKFELFTREFCGFTREFVLSS
ncbi:hypothetical protein QUF94_05825 [Peribacillus sp. NJ4]|nr:hypothetical protein [Peribacillus sp. NJ4]